MFWNKENECTRIVVTDTGNGLAKIDVHGSSLRVAGMLVVVVGMLWAFQSENLGVKHHA